MRIPWGIIIIGVVALVVWVKFFRTKPEPDNRPVKRKSPPAPLPKVLQNPFTNWFFDGALKK